MLTIRDRNRLMISLPSWWLPSSYDGKTGPLVDLIEVASLILSSFSDRNDEQITDLEVKSWEEVLLDNVLNIGNRPRHKCMSSRMQGLEGFRCSFRAVSNMEGTGEDTEKEIQEQHDRFHYAEAWRCALLLYIECIFKRDASQRSLALINLVRRTLDYIRCCQRSSSQTLKQLLLPVFLAGSETSDEGMPPFVKDYCAYWAETSRYSMLNSVPTLMKYGPL